MVFFDSLSDEARLALDERRANSVVVNVQTRLSARHD